VDPVSLVVQALAVGAATGLQESASAIIVQTYENLRDRLRQLWSRQPSAAAVLDQYAEEPAAFEAPLRHYLQKDGMALDADVVRLAGQLMELTDPQGAKAGKYTVNVSDARGVLIGDGSLQVNRFDGSAGD
jgi:hypothetical protein